MVLIGSSMGGATALWHAARRPAEVLASLLIAPAVGMGRGLERWAGEEVGLLSSLRRAEAVQVKKGETRPPPSRRPSQADGEMRGLALGTGHRQPLENLLENR